MTNQLAVSFQNVQVTAVPTENSDTGETYIEVTLDPALLTVTDPNTIINYQLVDPTPAEIQFTGIEISPENTQISPPAISTDGRNLTVSDINTEREDFSVVFAFNNQPAPQPYFRKIPDILNRPDL